MPNARFLTTVVAITILSTLGAGLSSWAEDWPQWRGPRRDGLSDETGLRREWNSAPPQLAWRSIGLGEGYSSVVVSRGRVFTIGRHGEKVVCTCLDENSGAPRWSRVVDQTSRMPCSTPTVDDNRLYMLDPDGELVCMSVENGEEIWRRSYLSDFGGIMMSGRGYGESPLVDGDHLICTPGGAKQTIVALNKHNGQLVWECSVPKLGDAGRPGAAFSSPVLCVVGGVRQYVQLVGYGLVGVRAGDGKLLWSYNDLANQTANIPTPIVHHSNVFAANGYNAGSVLLRLENNDGEVKANRVYSLSGSRFQNHHGRIVLLDGYVYGGHGSNNGLPTCLKLESGRIQWKRRGPGVGSAAVIYADKRLYFRYQNGVMALINATPTGYELHGTFRIPGAGGDSWAHPVVANGRLLLREKDRLFAYDIRQVGTGEQPTVAVHDELTAALRDDYTGRSLFRYARIDIAPVLHRIATPDITNNGTLKDAVLDRLRDAKEDIVVDLAGLPIRDTALAQVSTLPRLCGLNLELCSRITDDGIQHLKDSRRLRALRLTGTSVTDAGLAHLTGLPNLLALDLEVCELVTDQGCMTLGKMRQLRALVLKKTGFEPNKISSSGLSELSNLTDLEILNVYGNPLKDDSLVALAKMSRLRELDLSLTAISDQGLVQLAPLTQLERLELLYSEGFAGPKITDGGLQHLTVHKQLRTLNVVGAKISDDSLPHLVTLNQLELLRLANTRLSEAGIQRLEMQLPKCKIVR